MSIRNIVKVMNFHALIRVDNAKRKADKYRMMEEQLYRMMDVIMNNRNLILDKKVMELAEQIPTRYRVTREAVTDEKTPYITKYAMRLAAKKDTPPQTAKTAAKKKLGFPVPIRVWLKEDKYYSIVRERFESDEANRFFHTEKLVHLLDDHRAGKADNSRKIWTLYMFLVWYQIYFPEACGA